MTDASSVDFRRGRISFSICEYGKERFEFTNGMGTWEVGILAL